MSTSTVQPHNEKPARVWSSGGRNYDQISRGIADSIEHCVLRLDPKPGERILDLAAGTGWTSRLVARRGAEVIGADLVAAARERAKAEGLAIEYRIGDAENLPFADAEFDAVISTCGVMFASRPEAAAAEVARVPARADAWRELGWRLAMVAIAGFTKDQILSAVRQKYREVATAPSKEFHFPRGRNACLFVGYPESLLERVPATALESFAGVGCPFRAGVIQPGDVVLDVGAGSGTDTLIAAGLVGPKGRVLALDLTPEMLDKLRRNVALAGAANVEVIEGNVEAIPLSDASVDVVTSNGVLNLVPDKPKAFAEICRVLRPGGRVQIADIVVSHPVGQGPEAVGRMRGRRDDRGGLP